jgi:hypothetical protein
MRQWVAMWYVWTWMKFTATPMALACGIYDGRGDVFVALEVVRRSAAAMPGNFVIMLLGSSSEGLWGGTSIAN